VGEAATSFEAESSCVTRDAKGKLCRNPAGEGNDGNDDRGLVNRARCKAFGCRCSRSPPEKCSRKEGVSAKRGWAARRQFVRYSAGVLEGKLPKGAKGKLTEGLSATLGQRSSGDEKGEGRRGRGGTSRDESRETGVHSASCFMRTHQRLLPLSMGRSRIPRGEEENPKKTFGGVGRF